jgi:hypothetical protein
VEAGSNALLLKLARQQPSGKRIARVPPHYGTETEQHDNSHAGEQSNFGNAATLLRSPVLSYSTYLRSMVKLYSYSYTTLDPESVWISLHAV